jgi:carboxymethylenebutenolidase
MARLESFTSAKGTLRQGVRSDPAGSGKCGSVVVVQEWWGISPFIKSLCDRLAEAGFVALAPDLFHGKLPATKEEAAKAMGDLDKAGAIVEIDDAIAHLKTDPRGNGRVAVVGFCLGGALTLGASCNLPGIAAAVPFYGLPDVPMDAYARVKVPVQAHFAKHDDWAKASVAEQIQKAVRGGGGSMDLFVYDAGHAFMRTTDPETFEPKSAKTAWDRMVPFLKKHLD